MTLHLFKITCIHISDKCSLKARVEYPNYPLILWRRQTKSSPIFANILQLINNGTVSSKPLEFMRYLYSLQRFFFLRFSIFLFLTVHVYLKTYFYENYTAKSTFYVVFRSIGIFEISFTIRKISMKAFYFLTVRDHSVGLF